MRELTQVEKQWIFTPEALLNTPSANQGYTTEKELQKRKSIIINIRSLARASGLYDPRDPNHHGARGVMTVASTLVHRFYMRRSFKDFPEELMAGTILFLAAKIEEEPLKLRYICNSCLERFHNSPESGWHPGQQENGPPPSILYQRWEKEILATEEIVLETLCFDMGIEQPWVVLQRSLRGIDDLPLNQAESSRQAEERAQTIEKLSEAVVAELGWAILNEAYSSPLPILHPAPVLALSTLVLLIALLERIPLSRAISVGSELADRFDLDVQFDEHEGAQGPDLPEIRLCLDHFLKYCKEGLIDEGLLAFIPAEPETPASQPFARRYHVEVSPTAKKPSSPAKPDTRALPQVATETKQEASPHGDAMADAKSPVIEQAPGVVKVDSPIGQGTAEDVKLDSKVEDDEDLFGDKVESTGISPPRY